MSSEISIRVETLSKSFPIYDKPHHRLMQMIAPGPKDRWYRTFRALNDVSFEVRRGETVGIVGRNGSGKSTLLQLICGTLTPSVGTVQARGRIAALLELGAGFNPDFTGRENVYLNGSLLGLTRQELDERFDDIVAFADIGEFIEQPVKSYSSGMYIRLAFAVAINVMPDILVIDEALSVGDEAFQRKCFARIDAIRDAGATVLFVSHSAQSILQLCDRALLLERGHKLLFGTPRQVVAFYQKLIYAPADRYQEVVQEIQESQGESSVSSLTGRDLSRERPDDGVVINQLEASERFDPKLMPESTVQFESHGARILSPRILNVDGRQVNVLVPGRDYTYTYDVEFSRDAEDVHFGMMIKSVNGIELYGTDSHAQGQGIKSVTGGTSIRVAFRFKALMLPGGYFLNAGCMGRTSNGDGFLHRVVDVLMFKIEVVRSSRRYAGFFDISGEQPCEWEVLGARGQSAESSSIPSGEVSHS